MSLQLDGFAALVLRAQQGVDYDLVVRDRRARATVIALHGGCVEPLTGELAAAIAGDQWNLYLFKGLWTTPGEALRPPHYRLREIRCDRLLAQSATALAIDGCYAVDDALLVSGANTSLVAALTKSLERAGFPARATASRFSSLPQQCYNRARAGGALLEIPFGLRQALIEEPLDSRTPPPGWSPNPRWMPFVTAVQTAVDISMRLAESDLETTLDHFERTTREIQASGLLGPQSATEERT